MYGLKILCEIAKVPFEIPHKIFKSHTEKYAFYEMLKVYQIKNYDIAESWHLWSKWVGPLVSW